MSRPSTKLSELDPIDGSDAINVVIETTRGARTKLAYDDRREAFAVPVGAIVPCRLIGVIEAEQTEENGEAEENHRLIAVAEASELFADVRKLADLPTAVTNQIEHFFITYNEQAGKTFKPTGQHGRKTARSLLDKGHRQFQKKRRR